MNHSRITGKWLWIFGRNPNHGPTVWKKQRHWNVIKIMRTREASSSIDARSVPGWLFWTSWTLVDLQTASDSLKPSVNLETFLSYRCATYRKKKLRNKRKIRYCRTSSTPPILAPLRSRSNAVASVTAPIAQRDGCDPCPCDGWCWFGSDGRL